MKPRPQYGSPTASQDVSTVPNKRTTTLLVNNVHCASCVSYIQTMLHDLDKAIEKVDVSIVSHEVQVQHVESIEPVAICEALADAAFEINSFVSVDSHGNVVAQQGFPEQSEGWLEAAANIWRNSQGSPSEDACLPTPTRSKRKRHVENCAACQKQQLSRLDSSRSVTLHRVENYTATSESAGVPPADQTPVAVPDLEKQDSSTRLEALRPHTSIDQTAVAKKTEEHEQYVLSISIGGMTCASCTRANDDAIKNLDFVDSVDVDLMTNSAKVIFHGQEDLAKEVVTTVEDIGYEATIVSCAALRRPQHQPNPKEPANDLYRAVFSIGGMTCAACTHGITEGVQELEFVQSCNVTLMTNSALVTFRGCENLDTILEQVDDLGFDCSLETCTKVEADSATSGESPAPNKRQKLLKIDGMYCEHCVPRVLEAVAKFPKVEVTKTPSLENPVLGLTYHPNPPYFTLRNIFDAMKDADPAFSISISHPLTLEERSRAMRAHESKRILNRLILSFIFAIPTLLIGVIWMDLVPMMNSVRMFFMQTTWSGDVTRSQWALFILATPVYFLAADIFHLRAIKEIRVLWRRGSKVPVLRRFYRFGSMNLLISAGTTVAYVASLAILITGATTTSGKANTTSYFDTVVFLTFFILIGRYLEAYSKSKTGDAVGMLSKLRPEEALLVVQSDEQSSATEEGVLIEKPESQRTTKKIKAELLEIGDIVVVPRGSSPPGDGIILTGLAQMDESSMTGESRNVSKGPGEKVLVGTINAGDPITIEIVGIGGSSMLDQIVSVVQEGQTKRAPVERVADIITGYFVPVITALAIITFFIWFALGQSGALPARYLGNQAGGWAFWSLEFAIAVFVVACPCGIGLAAPTALFVGDGLAAKHGILVRGGGESFQEAADCDIVVFDKTGTLTEGGDLKVTDYEILDKDEAEVKMLWSIVRILEEQSTHPIAQAIVKLVSAKESSTIQMQEITEVPGYGIRGHFTAKSLNSGSSDNRQEAALGSEAFIKTLSPLVEMDYYTTSTLSKWKSQAQSVALLALRSQPSQSESPKPWQIAALFSTSDPIRASAAPTVAELQSRGISVYMLTGDNPSTAAAVASSLGIPVSNVFAGVLPTEKADKICWLQDYGPKRGSHPASSSTSLSLLHRILHVHQSAKSEDRPIQFDSSSASTPNIAHPPRAKAKVAFVGDGINDSPALIAATISISPATGSPIALSSSSFILLSEKDVLASIPVLLDLSRRVFRRIQYNFCWALAYNVLLVPIAAGVLFKVTDNGWRLGPVWASAAMALSSVSVVTASLALRWEGGWFAWTRREKGKDVA
ncbi:hypothetical protein MMC25_001098 [Agyrium rufum]|nr:hypothetical protein [Agyrium rufum]